MYVCMLSSITVSIEFKTNVLLLQDRHVGYWLTGIFIYFSHFTSTSKNRRKNIIEHMKYVKKQVQ